MTVADGSQFVIDYFGSARLTELHVDSALAVRNKFDIYSGAWIRGSLETGLLHIGEFTPEAEVLIASSATGRLGTVIIEQQGKLFQYGTTYADSVELRDGLINTYDALVMGDPLNPAGSTRLWQMAGPAGSSATHDFFSSATVHGSASFGGNGRAEVYTGENSMLEIHGDLSLAGSSATGTASLVIRVGSTLSAQSITVGTNGSDFDYGDSPFGPFPAGQATITMRSGTLNITGTAEEFLFPFAHTVYNAGRLTFGANDLLEGNGTIAFTNPQGGQLSTIGVISPDGYGLSQGKLLVQGDLMLRNGTAPLGPAAATLRIDLGGTAAGEFDVLHITGNADITNAILTLSLITGYSPQLGDTFYFMPVDGMLTGMFANLIDQTGLGLTLADLSLAETGGVMLTIPVTAVPEPGAYAAWLGLAAFAAVGLRRRQAR